MDEAKDSGMRWIRGGPQGRGRQRRGKVSQGSPRKGAQTQGTRKLQKPGKPWIAQEGDGGPGEAGADVEDPEAAGVGEGVDGAGGFR